MSRVASLVAMVVLAVGLTASPAQARNECEAPGPAYGAGDSGFVVVYVGSSSLRTGGGGNFHHYTTVGAASGLGYVQVSNTQGPFEEEPWRAHGRTEENAPADVSFDIDPLGGGVCLDVEGETVRI